MKDNYQTNLNLKKTNIMPDYISHEHEHDGIDRRGFLQCMAWAGTGLLWTVSDGVLVSKTLAQIAQAGEPLPATDLASCKSATATSALVKRRTKMSPRRLRLRSIASTRCPLRRLSLSIREILRSCRSQKSSTPSMKCSKAAGPRMFSMFLESTMCLTMAESFIVNGT